ncbi:Fe2+-enterobactin ABC transporter substrate-binding protein [Vibrio cincinnatiensis]|uniref:Fe2+-enterobactin ABC transporter substrate-binding protein n=1 Tax=Vibrio cincinnatiensis TaxID=675 RepID=UPI003B987322
MRNLMIINAIKTLVFITLLMSYPTQAQDWPRVFHNADGSTTTLMAPAKRILSTSVSITGTLLAVDAPVVASATTSNGHYFAQWQAVAEKKGVEPLWPAGSVDLEMVYAYEPDLIIVSLSGADSALGQLAVLRQVAPTVVLDYGGQNWQKLAEKIGEVAGIEQKVAAKISQFDDFIDKTRSTLTLPKGQVNIISYHGPGVTNPIATANGSHGMLLKSLGFDVEEPNPAWQTGSGQLNDFVRSHYEHLIEMTASTTFLLNATDAQVPPFLHAPVLANLPSVKANQVYGLGANSFRIDYFSAHEVIDEIRARFGN